MGLDKLRILVEKTPEPLQFDADNPIVALFNPNQLSVQKTVNWRDQPASQRDTSESQHTHGEPATLSLDLFFDTYEAGTDVTTYTKKIFHLSTVEEHGDKHRPPVCQLVWGKFGVFFQGVLQSLNLKFNLFLEDGTPVRATVSCTFKAWRSNDEDLRVERMESADVPKSRIVQRGDTLSSIAGEEYLDPGLWRPIAVANRIDDPLDVEPGMALAIPTLRERERPRR
jgi:nucleoid-associated protein YgaU